MTTDEQLKSLTTSYANVRKLLLKRNAENQLLTIQNEMLLEKVVRLQDEMWEKEMTWRICGRVV